MRSSIALSLCLLSGAWASAQTIAAPSSGDTTLTITTSPAATGSTIAIFTSAAPDTCSASSTRVPLAANTSALVLDGQKTTVVLESPLTESEALCAVITAPSAVAGGPWSTSGVTTGPAAAPPGYDWGLVRAYFTFGALLSQQNSQFSHGDLFMAFHLDKTYAQTGNLNASGKHSFKPGFNTFFDSRLTALPVAVQPCSDSSTSSTGSASQCSTASTNSTPSSSTTPATQVFLNSQKSARFQFGLYTPFLIHRWNVNTRTGTSTTQIPYALYVAPLFKTGFDTSVDSLNQTQQQSSTPVSVQAIGNSSSFYKFYDYGFRLGHYRLSNNADVSHDILSYLDVSWGRFSNMASLLCPTASYSGNRVCGTSAAPLTNLPWTREYRVSLEGMLEVPATHGFSVGFSANVSAGGAPPYVKNNVTYVKIRPQDDLRFLFAYRFDISQLAAKLAMK